MLYVEARPQAFVAGGPRLSLLSGLYAYWADNTYTLVDYETHHFMALLHSIRTSKI